MNRRIITAILAALVFTAQAASGAPAKSPDNSAVGFGLSDWHVSTGELDIQNYQTGDFTAPQPITLTRPGSSIHADRAVGNFVRKQATLTGNVVLHDDNGVLTKLSGAGGSNKPATLTCDTLQIDGVSKTYTATGNVHFNQGASQVSADRAVINGATHELHLFGHVQLQQ